MWCSIPGYKTLYWPSEPLSLGRQKTIECRSFSLCLGIAIDLRLSCAKHVHVLSVSTSYSSKVKTLRRISSLPKATPETIYYKTVIPSILYSIAVWGSCSDYLMKDLELIHLRAARLTYKQPRDMADETVIIKLCKLEVIKLFLLFLYSKHNA